MPPRDRARPRAPLPPLDDPAFHALKARIIARTGHHYYADKDAQLWEKVQRRLAALGIAAPAAYLERLDDASAGPREWGLLESAVTINETFFFRFAEQFAALRTAILPALIEARRDVRTLRIWSAGCSTGAEPYSLAVLVHDLLGDALPGWRVAITGSDIDETALGIARDGLFGAWTLRGMGEGERQRLFVREGDGWRIRPAYRALVRFERMNLLDLPDGLPPFDLILCRNVLIYFRVDLAMGVARALGGRLAPDGWLLLGHAEPGPAADAGLAMAEVAGVLAWRPATASPTPPAPPQRPAEPPPPRVRRPRPARRDTPAPAAPPPAPPSAGPRPVEVARAALASGDAAAALAAAGEAARADPRDPVPHYLQALAALALDDGTAAEAAFRRTTYLDPGFAMAHYVWGRHLLARGRVADGRRALINAGRAVAANDGALAEGDGMTANDMAAAVRHAIGTGA